MAITDYKITDNEINTYNVKSAPNTLTSNAQSNKNWFDRLGEFFISKYNSLLDFIQGDFVSVDEVGAGLAYRNDLEWKHALQKDTMIANYSGNITAITTGYRTIIANVTGLTTDDFMDCIMNINGTDYQCADAYESGDYATTTCDVEGVEVTITYSLSGGDITLTHTQNPLDTLYWNIQMFSTVADKIPAKSLPGNITNSAYAELSQNGKWHNVELHKGDYAKVTQSGSYSLSSGVYRDVEPHDTIIAGAPISVTVTDGTETVTVDTVAGVGVTGYFPPSAVGTNRMRIIISQYSPYTLTFYTDKQSRTFDYTLTYTAAETASEGYIPIMADTQSDTAGLVNFSGLLANTLVVERKTVATDVTVATGNTSASSASVEKTGYTAIGIVGAFIEREGETAGHGVLLTRFYVVNDVGYWRLFNGGSADRTVNIYFDVLYIKNA